MDTRPAAARWAATWRRAWEALDADAIVALYAAEARLTPPAIPSRRGGA